MSACSMNTSTRDTAAFLQMAEAMAATAGDATAAADTLPKRV